MWNGVTPIGAWSDTTQPRKRPREVAAITESEPLCDGVYRGVVTLEGKAGLFDSCAYLPCMRSQAGLSAESPDERIGMHVGSLGKLRDRHRQ